MGSKPIQRTLSTRLMVKFGSFTEGIVYVVGTFTETIFRLLSYNYICLNTKRIFSIYYFEILTVDITIVNSIYMNKFMF